MAILVDNETRLVVQGITGREGRFHTGRMVESGTNAEEGSRILAENTPENVHTEETMLGAAERAVELARNGGR